MVKEDFERSFYSKRAKMKVDLMESGKKELGLEFGNKLLLECLGGLPELKWGVVCTRLGLTRP